MVDKDKNKDQATRTKGAESGVTSTAAGLKAKNPLSSARGPYQILDGTWSALEKTAKRKLDRNSAADNDLAFELYTKNSERILAKNGIEATPGNTYALHVFGPAGGIKYLQNAKANPNGLSTEGMSAAVINGNKAFFYGKDGKARTNADSYGTLAARVGGASDPGRVSLEKKNEKIAFENIQRQNQQNQQMQEEAQMQEEQIAEQPEEEIAENPEDQQEAPLEETSQLSQASNSSGMIFNGDRKNPGNFILPNEPIQEDIKTSGDASMKAKTFAYGGPIDPKKGAATRQDSIALKEDSLRLLKDYQARGYAKTNVKFPENDLDKSLSDIQSRKGTTEVIRNGVRKAEKYNPSEYRTEINENQYRQRESANGVLNMDVTPALYDKRVKPTSFLKLMGKEAGTWNDGVSVPYYGDMEISPAKPEAKPAQNYAPVNKSLARTPQPQKVANAIQQPAVQSRRTSPYMERPQTFSRDNTRVGSSFSGVDPRIARKASSFADGGEIDNGLLNDFNEGGRHEENPNGGIPQGMDPSGALNTVEEGETKMGQYVFSDRLKLDKMDVDNLYLPRQVEGMTYADASKFINEFLEENPFDIIIKKTAQSQLESLIIGNDRARKFKEEEEQIIAETDEPESAKQYSLSSSQENEMPEEMTEEMPANVMQEPQIAMAYGGNKYQYRGKNKYADGGAAKGITDEQMAGGVAALGTGLELGTEAFKKYDPANLDNIIQKQSAGMAIAGGAVKGAAAGAALGPWGAAIGGVVGGGLGFIGAGRANKAANIQETNMNSAEHNNKYGFMAKDSSIRVAAYGGRQNQSVRGGVPDVYDLENPVPGMLDLTNILSPGAAKFGKANFVSNTPSSFNRIELDKGIASREANEKAKDKAPFQMKKDNILKYAGAVGALSNYVNSRKEKARQINSELIQKVSTPNYYDEAIIQNSVNQESNNRSQAILATSGGSASAARAMSTAGNNDINKLKSDSYFKMFEVNNGIRNADQVESQRIADTNVGIRNTDYQANLAEQDYVLGRKEKSRDNLYSSVEAIGTEQNDRNLIYNLSRGYNVDGSFDPEGKNNALSSLVQGFNSMRGRKSEGGLLELYEKGTSRTKDQEMLEFIKNKYNG